MFIFKNCILQFIELKIQSEVGHKKGKKGKKGNTII